MQQDERPIDEAKAMARDAGSWLKRRGCLFWGVAIVAVLYVIGRNAPTPPADPAVQAAAGDAVKAATTARAVTAAELFKAYAANEVAAQGEYGGQVLDVSGTIASIALDITDSPVIEFTAGGAFDHVQAGFDKDWSGRIARLAKGQKLTVRCGKVSEVLGNPVLSECQLVR